MICGKQNWALHTISTQQMLAIIITVFGVTDLWKLSSIYRSDGAGDSG